MCSFRDLDWGFEVFVLIFAPCFCLKKTRSKCCKFPVARRHRLKSSAFYHLYWGLHSENPYLLILPFGKTFHRALDNFETGQSSNKPVKAKLRRRKRNFLPLLSPLLSANPKQS